MYGKILAMVLSLGMVSSMGIVSNAVEGPSTKDTSNTENITGDVNNDGVVNVLDTLALKNHILEGKTIVNYTYDINGDDIVNKVDLIQNKRASFELDTFSYYNDGIYDELIPCIATINDNFYDDVIIVTIKHQYSQVNKSWTAKDFGNLDNIKSISDYTYLDWNADEIYNYSYGDNIVFRQQLRIELKDKSKQNVLDMINAIESMNIPDIKRVSPNYMFEGILD